MDLPKQLTKNIPKDVLKEFTEMYWDSKDVVVQAEIMLLAFFKKGFELGQTIKK